MSEERAWFAYSIVPTRYCSAGVESELWDMLQHRLLTQHPLGINTTWRHAAPCGGDEGEVPHEPGAHRELWLYGAVR